MTMVSKDRGTLKVNAYVGDAKTLLAFNLTKANAKNLAGFTVQVQPGNKPPYYILNELQYEKPSDHAQDPKLPPNSTFNAPIHKFRWLHVPGSAHQGLKPFFGTYTYTVTPRYFDGSGSLLPIDTKLSVALDVPVKPFVKGSLSTGFTRGFTQSQAFVHHFGPKVRIQPPKSDLIFDTSVEAGKNPKGEPYTYDQEYEWLGFTAQDRLFEILDEVIGNKSLHLDVFAYDLSEPNFAESLIKVAKQGRIRVILDNASLHKTSKKTGASAEDAFEKLFRKADKTKKSILRGHFGRFAHDKCLIVSDKKGARTVLTGSTNFSITGFYVNSNHVIVFDDREVAKAYADVFEFAWENGVKNAIFQKSPIANKTFSFSSAKVPKTDITFSPHTKETADKIMGSLVSRIEAEGKKASGSVMFAVMEMGAKSDSVVYQALNDLHAEEKIFSYGISDNPRGIFLYKPGQSRGLLVTGKPVSTMLPPPFNQVPNIAGQKHQIHHKFVVCGFNSKDAVVYCGSSNLANKGETVNGDNLLAIRDQDVATVFAIEAVGLVDHFNFLDNFQNKSQDMKGKKPKTPPASLKDAATLAHWFLSTTDAWTKPYYDANDLHCADRQLFG
jgi:phospholipase D-like protein